MWTRGSRNVARSTRVTRLPPPPPPPPLRSAYRRFGLRWRGRLDATSREYLAPSPRHQPAAAPWPAAVGPYSTSSLLPPRPPPSPLPVDTRPGSLVRSLALSRRQSRLASFRRLVLGPSLSPPPLSACVPETPDSFLPPFSFSRPFRLSPRSYAGCLVRPPPLSPSVPCRRHPRRQPPSRRRAPMTVAVRRTREGEKEARVTPAFWLGIVTGRPAYERVCGRVSRSRAPERERDTI